jgi:16S rRNA processing protein RimM
VSQRVGPSSADGNSEGWVAIARVARPWGRRGEVVAEILTDFPLLFESRRRVFLEGFAGPMIVESARLHQGRVVLKFSGTDSISQAERWRGRNVFVPSEERVALPSEHYYHSDLCGARVARETADGLETVGVVETVEETGGVDLLRVRTREGEALIPLAQDICKRIDTAAKIIVVDPPEGLLEANLQPNASSAKRQGEPARGGAK